MSIATENQLFLENQVDLPVDLSLQSDAGHQTSSSSSSAAAELLNTVRMYLCNQHFITRLQFYGF